MDYTLSQNSIHQNMEDYMMLCEYEAATRTRVSSTEENSRFYTPHEHELETFALAYSIVNSNGATPTNGDLGWSRLPTPTLPQTVDRWNTETAAGSNSHRSSGYGTGNLDLRISPQLSHNDVNTSSSATHSHDALSPSSFAGLEHKVTYQYQLSDREKYPSKEQKCRLRSPQYVSDSQSVFYMPFSEPIFPMFIESTRVPQHEATAADDSPAPISSPTFEEHSDLADEDLGELHDDVDQIEELEKLHEPPYSDLIYRAIVSSPNKHMRVQEIYSWFKENTNKCGNSDSTGWQNSIRHNLSMNAGFEALKQSDPNDKRVYTVWRISDKAMVEGIHSTARYRKTTVSRRVGRTEPPSPRRQKSGAKGGRNSAITSKLRRLREMQNLLESKPIPE